MNGKNRFKKRPPVKTRDSAKHLLVLSHPVITFAVCTNLNRVITIEQSSEDLKSPE